MVLLICRICNETKALEGYKDELKPVFKSTPTQFQTIIFATSDTQNVGDSDGDVSETLAVSQRTIERDLSTLQKIGVLKRKGKENVSHLFGLCKVFGRNVWEWRWF